MSHEYTKGPWEITGQYLISAGGGPWIAQASQASGAGFRSLETLRANLALISASPDMYEELEKVQWSGEEGLRICPNCRAFECDGHKPDCTLNAALKKARPEENTP